MGADMFFPHTCVVFIAKKRTPGPWPTGWDPLEPNWPSDGDLNVGPKLEKEIGGDGVIAKDEFLAWYKKDKEEREQLQDDEEVLDGQVFLP